MIGNRPRGKQTGAGGECRAGEPKEGKKYMPEAQVFVYRKSDGHSYGHGRIGGDCRG